MTDQIFRIERVSVGQLALSGELDMGTAPQLTKAIAAERSEGNIPITLDVSALEFVDSSGLRCLLDAIEDAPIQLRQPREQLSRLLAITGLTEKFPVVP